MAIPIPTIDDFQESTVMTIIREILNYICGNNGLVDAINDNDITSFNSSYSNNVLKIDAVKGDGTTIPVCNVTIEGGSSESNPYPTAVSIQLSGTTLKFSMTMSAGSPITASADLSSLAGGGGAVDTVVLSKSGNNITLSVNGAVQNTINPINTVTGSVSGSDLTIGVNGVNSSPITLPTSSTGDDGWEELPLTSWPPTTFNVGDSIKIIFKAFPGHQFSASSWTNSAPISTEADITIADTTVEFSLADIETKIHLLMACDATYTYFSFSTIKSIQRLELWNRSARSSLLSLNEAAFNANGVTPAVGNISNEAFISGKYIKKMYIKRAS